MRGICVVPFGAIICSAAVNIFVHAFGEQHPLGDRYLGIKLNPRIKALDFRSQGGGHLMWLAGL